MPRHDLPPSPGENGCPGLVSIVIPCYNQAHFLVEAIESALAQTYAPVEIVVVDDGSPDNTSEVAARYPPVRCVRQENRGLPGARNTGWRASRGEFLMFLDADDRLAPNAVEAHVRCFAQHPEAGWVVGDIDKIGADGAYKDSPRWPLLTANFYEELLRVNHVANTIAVMFRRSALETLGPFDQSLPASEDYEMLLRAARAFPSAHHRNVVAYYRRYPTSMSRNGLLMLSSMRRIMRSQRTLVKHQPQLAGAWRQGDAHWRDLFGAITCQEVFAHLRRGQLVRAAKKLGGLLFYGRTRVLLLPWTFRDRIWRTIRKRMRKLLPGHRLRTAIESDIPAV